MIKRIYSYLFFTTFICGFADTSLKTYHDQTITPSAGPRVENGADVFITADLLFWDATQQGFDFAVSSPTSSDSPEGNIYYAKFGFDPGFQVGLGLNLGHDAWDTLVNYTWFHPGSQTRSFNQGSSSLSFFQAGSKDSSFESAQMLFTYKLDVIDFEIGRNYLISQYLSLRPFIGLKTAWNKQTTKQIFDDLSTIYTIRGEQKAFEIGLRTGLNTGFLINQNWLIYANFALSSLSNDVKNKSTTTTTFLDEDSEIASFSAKQDAIQPVLETSLGIEWNIWSDNEEYHLGLGAGWDFQYWNNNLYTAVPLINQVNDTISGYSRKSGDLTIQGLNIKLRFDF